MRCWSCLSCDRAIRWHYYFRRSVGHLFTVFHVFDAHSGKDADGPHRRPCLLLTRGCASWHKNRVLQSAEPKEAVVQRESLEFMSHEATEMRFAVSGTMDKVVGGERGRVSVAALSSPARTGRAMWHRRAPSSALPRWGEGRAHSLKSRQGVAQDHKRGS